MTKTFLYGLVLSTSLLGLNASAGYAADNACIILGGTALANATDDTHFIASLSGAFASAKAEVTTQTKTETGLALTMEHYFFEDRGGMLRTEDVAILTNVEGRENVYMIEIKYDIHETSGAFEGYSGSFQSFGLFDLNKGQVVLRYKGEICKS
ncbi:MAG: hypothetical protein JKY99_12455 [Rhizobiales bacterium]|nr:hypothetical protein [Hyphomicrobiales bacterium]